MDNTTQRLSDGIYRIQVPLPGNPLKVVNDYYLKGGKRDLLIDTAFNRPECLSAARQGLESVGADMDRTDIFLTHLHSDHAGLAEALAGPGTRIFIGEIDRRRLARFFEEDYWDSVYKRNLMLGFSEAEIGRIKTGNPASKYLPGRMDRYMGVEDGHVFDLGGFRLRCVSTPGHTPGHICLYEEDSKVLFCGDHIIFDITPNITYWPGFQDSLGVYLESLVKVRGLDISRALPGHRNLEGDVYARIDELIAHHGRRLDEVVRIVTDSDGITAYDIASKMTWSIRARSWAEFPETQKWFAVGEASAHIEHLLLRGGLTSEIQDNRYVFRLS